MIARNPGIEIKVDLAGRLSAADLAVATDFPFVRVHGYLDHRARGRPRAVGRSALPADARPSTRARAPRSSPERPTSIWVHGGRSSELSRPATRMTCWRPPVQHACAPPRISPVWPRRSKPSTPAGVAASPILDRTRTCSRDSSARSSRATSQTCSAPWWTAADACSRPAGEHAQASSSSGAPSWRVRVPDPADAQAVSPGTAAAASRPLLWAHRPASVRFETPSLR